ncbi:hypothetical protein [Elizabethkingia ursingii]
MENLDWEIQEEILNVSDFFRSVIFNIHKTDKEKVTELHNIYKDALLKHEKHSPIFRYNIKLEMIKFLFNETKYYSNMNDFSLFKHFSIHPGFSSQQLTNIDFHFEIQKYYKENYYNPEIEVGNYNELSKVYLWFSYDSTLFTEVIIRGSDSPLKTRKKVINSLQHKIINLESQITNNQDFLNYFSIVKDRYLNEIKSIKHNISTLKNIQFDKTQDSGSSELDFERNIFKSQESQMWFFDTLRELNVHDGKRPFGAVISAIFRNDLCKEHIFTYNISQKDYINYLNIFFRKNANSTKLSDNEKHIDKIEELIKLFLSSE